MARVPLRRRRRWDSAANGLYLRFHGPRRPPTAASAPIFTAVAQAAPLAELDRLRAGDDGAGRLLLHRRPRLLADGRLAGGRLFRPRYSAGPVRLPHELPVGPRHGGDQPQPRPPDGAADRGERPRVRGRASIPTGRGSKSTASLSSGSSPSASPRTAAASTSALSRAAPSARTSPRRFRARPAGSADRRHALNALQESGGGRAAAGLALPAGRLIAPREIPDACRQRHNRRHSADARARNNRHRLRDRPPRHRVHLARLARAAVAGGIAAEVGMKPLALQRLFTRWAGLTPKGFLQAVTLDHARALLANSASVLDASYEVGLSGPGRLHDLFVTHEAMTPGAYKARGEGIVIRYGFHASPFGTALVMVDRPRPRRARLRRSRRRGGGARRHEGAAGRAPPMSRTTAATAALRPPHLRPADMAGRPAAARRHDRHAISRCASGRRCSSCRSARATTYSDIAAHIGKPIGGPRRRCGGRQEPDLLRRALPPRARQGRRPLRLPLGPDPQARDPRLGSRRGRRQPRSMSIWRRRRMRAARR